MAVSSGTRLGRYEIRSKLGAGGMGEVYLAQDTRLGRCIALKILPSEVASDQKRMQRFIQEAQATSALNHPNIITIHEVEEIDSTHFIATEFIEGETLRQRMSRSRITIAESLDIAIQVASALTAAHEVGIIHRDIKPENIMLRRDGIVKVLDFGLVKLTEMQSSSVDTEAPTKAIINTEPGTVMGTAHYMSPEQARGLETDARTDIWSLGVVFYEMVTGHQPFTGETMTDVLASIVKGQPAPPTHHTIDAPARLEEIISKALEKDKEERYQGIKDLLVDLRRLKKRIEFEAEMERSVATDSSSAPTIIMDSAQLASETKRQIAKPSNTAGNLQAGDAGSIHATPGARYPMSGITRYKRGVTVILLMVIFAAAGLGIWFFSNRSVNTKQIESIAVLPFINESGNTDNEYLSDGMTESLINSLSRIPALSVKARSSVFRYKGKETDLRKIAGELNVQAILTGKVSQRGDQLILNLELVDGKTENVIWSEQYHRRQLDLVSLQSEIARDVSNKLRAKLSGAEQNQIAKNYTANSEAYQLYLKGRFFLNKGTRDGQKKSVEYFKQAINLDPNFALGYSGTADAYTLLGATFEASLPPREAMPNARTAAQKALEIDPRLSEAHTSLAWIKYRFDWDWSGAEDDFRQAIALNPNNAQAHHWYADYLTAMGRFDEALAEIRRARELDPFSLFINWNVGRILYFARRYDEALTELRRTLEMDQNFMRTHVYLESIYLKKGMNDEALAERLRVEALTGTSAERIAALKNAYAAGGWEQMWQKEVDFALEDAQSRYITSLNMAFLYTKNGDRNRALESLSRAYEEREGSLVNLNVDPFWDDLRADPRFQDLLRRLGFPP